VPVSPILSTRMVVAYANHVVSSNVSAIGLVGVGTDPASSTSNLLYEDASLQWVSTTPSSSGLGPEVIFTFNPELSVGEVFGIFNWTGYQEWDSVLVQAGASASGPWSAEIVTIDLSPALPVPGDDSKSFLVRHAGASGSFFRFTFLRVATPRPKLRIGNICMFKAVELSQNPDTGGIRQSRVRAPRGHRALGGALHVARSVNVADTSAQFAWSRMDDTLLNQINDVDVVHGDNWIGIIPPNQVGRELPLGLPHFLGRSLNLDATALHGASPTTHASRVVWTLEGAL